MKRTCSLMSRVGLVRLKGGEDIFKVQTAARAIEKRLYVSIPVLENESLASLQKRLGDVYHAAFASDPHVDTMVLLRGTNPPDVTVFLGYQEEEAEANQLNVPHHVLAPRESGCAPLSEATGDADLKQYTSMCMGGTFDRLHVGQKLLLSSAAHCMKPGGRLFCGIAGDALFKEKALRELIQPYGRRERVVRQFFSTIRPDVCYETAELTDGYGPSIVEPSIEAIIVTEETASGGAKCNEVRAEKGFPAMDVVTIGLISASGELTANLPTTAKLSSTGQRQAKIGGLFHDPRFFCKRNTNKAYTICVTGGIATGKSTVSQILAKQDDVEMINADQLGHLAYEIGSESNRKIKETFSPLNPAVAAEDGSIDRKVLGSLVFGEDKTNMTKLTDIVWPAIRTMITTKIAESTARVLVVEAAVAKEAGWEDMFDEVWLCVIPPAVAKARLMERNSLSAEDAEKRIASQLTGPERMTTAHVLLSNHKDVAALSEDTLLAYKDVLSRTSTTLSSLDGIAATWSQLAADAGLTPESTAYWWREVRDRYAQTGRDYHTLSHLEEMFSLLEEVSDKIVRKDLVSWAIFFHDVIYNPRSRTNEVDSAALWRVFAQANRAGISQGDEDTVALWIEETANHVAAKAEGDLAYFLDIDIAILGQDPSRYCEYAEQISLEYNHVDYSDFKRLRPLALSGFTQNPEGPYKTETFQTRFGKKAVANLRDEIARLNSKL